MVCQCGKASVTREFKADDLTVGVYANRAEMGQAAARDVAAAMRKVIAAKGKVTMVFAAAPSQNEFLATLSADTSLDWSKVTVFHLDEYVGLASDAPQGFGNFLRQHVFDRVNPATIYFMNGNAPDIEAECRRYGAAVVANPIDIACIGIGENGHLAFNDPPIADFSDPKTVKVVELEERCRLQQVHDGCFSTMDQVPTHALTMTVPAIVSAAAIFCMVPGSTKAEAVSATVSGPIATSCPASILRRYGNTTLYLDANSAKLI
ncbi:MAG: glucosamine-6-phosphate deaminase [Anaerolineae bacterium]